MSKTIIVSNRLPVKMIRQEDNWSYSQSEGGLATGLSSIYKEGNNVWVGWPGAIVRKKDDQQQVRKALAKINLIPVFLTQDDIDDYYEGFSNEVLWPICHYVPSYAQYHDHYWYAYRRVNKKFAEAVLKIAEKGDMIWVQDYQLLLLPQMMRERISNLSIAFFQHIPFPSYEVFRQIPWRESLLEGVMGADLIGFHTYDDIRHFISAATRILTLNASANKLVFQDRTVMVDAFPMGIDFEKFERLTRNSKVWKSLNTIRQSTGKARIMTSIDRLDYSKGIVQRLQAFDLLLKTHPEYKEEVCLLMVVVPSRDNVPQYKELKEEIDILVSNINARNQTMSWQPVHYFYRPFPQEMLSALYQTAEVCLVTPLRDGMNLVSKEYVASRVDEKGVLVLSEMAGAAKELSEALIINPNDVGGLTEAIYRALTMPKHEQQARMQTMRETVRKFNIHHWVKLFMDRLNEIKKMQDSLLTRLIVPETAEKICKRYKEAKKRIIYVDYDGTLVAFHADPSRAKPDPELYDLLKKLAADSRNRIVIISGRKYDTLEKWFKDHLVDMIAEHGAWNKKDGQPWRRYYGLSDDWKQEIRPVMEQYTDRTPGTFIEEKSYSLGWHYRKAELGLGEQRATELEDNLKFFAVDRGLQILEGNKVIEVKSNLVNKGKAAAFFLEEDEYDFIMALGDDMTDEDTFRMLPRSAITIKVGNAASAARFCVNTHQDARALLKKLVTSA